VLYQIHALVTWVLVGSIWTVQWVHYPLLAEVSPDRFRSYHRAHVRRMSVLVMPLAGLELACAVLVVASLPANGWGWLGLVLLGVNTGATVLILAPLHLRLAAGYDIGVIQRLTRWNWVRTVAWTLRGGAALQLLQG